ncbi:MAG TPA: NAD-binding protein [Phycisphaerae bacterium]|jgi:D-arabinose 1-dehydrogenase-like Zn-dependent alcohol dehydrogenase|nr:hypothetical protein [Phycisphaerae bacterium]HOB76016.1 NAD-binding protein [Phycisphaerae bacterium]HOJ53483.1 NAD-binding protein [Phycisphaerae bacterium]HOL25360.1 NAD-binding protein [Phycisphaerae bacterium]HPP21864.1 NAD-binding protein [Phycisphaerae bacterium]
MGKRKGVESPSPGEYFGIYENGCIRLSTGVDWPEGTAVVIRMADLKPGHVVPSLSKVIVAGFGLAGRSVAGLCERYGIEYVIVERNARTIQTQRELGRQVVEGDISEEQTMRAAGIEDASLLALAIPDEHTVRRATQIARALNPHVYIIGQAVYASTGMQIEKHGADDVIKVEQLVAREFYEHLLRILTSRHEGTEKKAALDGGPVPGGNVRG